MRGIGESAPHRLAALLAAGALALAGAGCGGDDDGGSGSNSEDVPSGAVATVGDVEISREQLDRQVETLARAQRRSNGSSTTNAAGGGGGGAASEQAREQQRELLETQALSMLLQQQALEQEAAERGVKVAPAEVRERWDAAKQGQFKTRRALRRFLGGQTERDVLRQLRMQLLTERIVEDVRENADGDPDKAVKEFQEQFTARWAERTACAKGYDSAAGCAKPDSK